MLTAAQIDAVRDAAEQLLDPVIDYLVEDIARRVKEAGQLTGTASYEVWRAQKLGVSQKQLKKKLQEKLKMSAEDLEKLLKQAAKTGYNFDLSRFPTDRGIPFAANSSIQQIVAAAVQQAQDGLNNITRTMGFVGADGQARELTDAYRKACDDAYMRTVTGAQDYTSAIRDATRGLAERGILSLDYQSGRHYTVEAAVRQNIMGGLGLMQEQISQQNHDDLGCDGWEISAHGGSAPDHEPIQGKQYTDKQYKRINDHLLRRIGTLNCGHAAFPIIMGVNDPQYTTAELEELRQQNEAGVTVDGRHYTRYEATQRQRKLERSMRNQKRKILIDKTLEDEEKLQIDQIKLVRIRDEYARFSKEAGLPTQHARAEAAGFTWKDAKAAEKAAKQAETAAREAAEQAEKAAKEAARIKMELEKQKEREYNEKVERVREHIRSDAVPKKLNKGHQQKHIKDSPGYLQGRSYIYGDLDVAQALVDKYHGTGTPVFKRNGEWKEKEIVVSDSVIGVNVDDQSGEETETNRFVIHYGKKGTHVVPTKEEKHEPVQTIQ